MSLLSPSRSAVHVNRPLSNISEAYIQDEGAFVASRLFPDIPVEHQTDLYWSWPRGEFFRAEMAVRADGAESAGKDYKIETKSYRCVIRALNHDISDPQRANQDDEVNLDRGATVLLTQDAMITKELVFVDEYMKDSVWTYSADGAATRSTTFTALTDANNNLIYWSDASSTPIQDVRLLKRIIHSSTGFRPNVLVLGREAYDILLDHTDIIARLDRGQTTGPVMATRESLAALFELEEILIMDAVVNSGVEGASDAIDFVGGGKDGLLAYRTSMPGTMMPSAGYTFSWNAYGMAGNMGSWINKMRIDTRKSDRIEIESAYDMHVVGADLGCFLDGIVE